MGSPDGCPALGIVQAQWLAGFNAVLTLTIILSRDDNIDLVRANYELSTSFGLRLKLVLIMTNVLLKEGQRLNIVGSWITLPLTSRIPTATSQQEENQHFASTNSQLFITWLAFSGLWRHWLVVNTIIKWLVVHTIIYQWTMTNY